MILSFFFLWQEWQNLIDHCVRFCSVWSSWSAGFMSCPSSMSLRGVAGRDWPITTAGGGSLKTTTTPATIPHRLLTSSNQMLLLRGLQETLIVIATLSFSFSIDEKYVQYVNVLLDILFYFLWNRNIYLSNKWYKDKIKFRNRIALH